MVRIKNLDSRPLGDFEGVEVKANPLLLCDFYKIDHRRQYPPGTTLVYSNFTARRSKTEIQGVIFFGLRAFILEYLVNRFQSSFFALPKDKVVQEYQNFIIETLKIEDFDVSHIEALHSLQYLPLEIKALPEGAFVPCGVPCLTIKNTHPDFFWLVNYIETIMSNSLWGPSTSATTAYHYRMILEKYAGLTLESMDFVDYQAHDFSFRGLQGLDSASTSGAAHLLFFKGTDTIPAILFLKRYYNVDIQESGTSVFATEHSVMCAGGQAEEEQTYRRLITEVYPSGVVSIVSDTWDLWSVLTNILPNLKDEITKRAGKVVIRPDSGDPVKIICGDEGEEEGSAGYLGVLQLLWNIFGGHINNRGFKELNPCIGIIYGENITPDVCNEICALLYKKGFASNCIVFGVGSSSYQYVTRDTYGFAFKATYCEVNGEGRAIFKDPITKGDTPKKSALGLLQVRKNDGLYYLKQNVTKHEEESMHNELKVVFKDGQLFY